jgi:hypothetical protein
MELPLEAYRVYPSITVAPRVYPLAKKIHPGFPVLALIGKELA